MTCSQPSKAYIPTPDQDAITSKKNIISTHQHVLPRECTYLILDHVWTTWHVEGQGKPVCSAVFTSHVPIPGSQWAVEFSTQRPFSSAFESTDYPLHYSPSSSSELPTNFNIILCCSWNQRVNLITRKNRF